jgi:type I restriction enzyme, S subunit
MKVGWQTERLGDVVTRLTNGYVGPTRNIYIDSGVPYLLARHVRSNRLLFDGKTFISDEFNRKNKKSMLNAGDVLLVQSGHIGHSAVVTDEHEGDNCHAMIVISPIKDVLTGTFLSLLFNAPDMQLKFEDIRSGSTVPHLTCGAVKELEIPVPPLPEQHRIVAILDEAFAGIATAKANAEQNLRSARALFESQLGAVFSRRGEGWREKPLEAVADILNGYAFKSADFSHVPGVKCIKITNVGVREFVSESGSYLPDSFATKYSAVSVKNGSIVLALTRTIIAGGLKVALVPDEYDGALLNQRVASIMVNHEFLTAPFLFGYLSTQGVVDYVAERVNTLMQPNLSISDLRSMPIPVPPLPEQSQIADQVAGLRAETQRLASLYQRKLAALDELKKSLLHQAFSGQL